MLKHNIMINRKVFRAFGPFALAAVLLPAPKIAHYVHKTLTSPGYDGKQGNSNMSQQPTNQPPSAPVQSVPHIQRQGHEAAASHHGHHVKSATTPAPKGISFQKWGEVAARVALPDVMKMADTQRQTTNPPAAPHKPFERVEKPSQSPMQAGPKQ